MQFVTKFKFILPYLILLTLVLIIYRELSPQKDKVATDMIGESLPAFSLADLQNPQLRFTNKTVLGKVSLVNVWSSWCYACHLEQPMLMTIQQDFHVPIYGINYKDKREDALNWLKKYGDPFTQVGSDNNGQASVDLGVYGTPETFVINEKGEIIYRHVGVLTKQVWQEVIYPMVKQAHA